MPKYLVAIQHPEDYDPSLEGEAMIRDIGALNEEMDAAGARFFAGGLESASHARSLRKQPDGNASITDGPYLEAKEHIGGYWIIQVRSREEAIEWAKRAPMSNNERIEVRQIHEMSDFPEDVQKAAEGFEHLNR